MPARISDAGITGYLVAIVVGLVVGVGSAWLMWRMHRRFHRWMTEHEERASREGYAFAFYLSKLLWIVCASVTGFYLSLTAQRLLH